MDTIERINNENIRLQDEMTEIRHDLVRFRMLKQWKKRRLFVFLCFSLFLEINSRRKSFIETTIRRSTWTNRE